MLACIALVVIFKNSSNLASAYSIAVTGTMVITTILFTTAAMYLWNWSKLKAFSLLVVFLVVDLSFFSANLSKIIHGGWIPLAIGTIIFIVMTTWKRGREYLGEMMLQASKPLASFFAEITEKTARVPGTAVFMTLSRDIAPSVLLHHFKHNKSLHEKIILLSVLTKHVPEISNIDRVRVTELEHGFFKIVAAYGYMETPDITEIMEIAASSGLIVDMDDISYYLGRETFLTNGDLRMASWRKKLFVLLSKNARSATEFFRVPPDRVIEIGFQIKI